MSSLRRHLTTIKFAVTFSTILPFAALSHVLMTFRVPGHWVLSHVMDWWVRLMFWLNGVTVAIEGWNFVPDKGPYIFVANHRSLLDFSVVSYLLQDKPVYVMKKELGKIPLFGWLVTRAGTLYLERNNRDKDLITMDLLGDKLRDGYTTLIFPEGTRSPDGKLQPFKKGSFHVAVRSGAPLIPVSIHNSRELLAPHDNHITPGTMIVRIHEPISVAGYDDETIEALVDRCHGIIRKDLAVYETEPYETVPVSPPVLLPPASTPAGSPEEGEAEAPVARWKHGLRILDGTGPARGTPEPTRPTMRSRRIRREVSR